MVPVRFAPALEEGLVLRDDAPTVRVLVRGLGGSVATHGEGWSLGYGVVYVVGFALCVLGSVFVTRIRSVA